MIDGAGRRRRRDRSPSSIGDPDDPGMPEAPIDEDDLLAIIYTSGTTGRPKGATLTHRQVIANLSNIIVLGVAAGDARHAAARGAKPGCRSASLLVVPLFHVTGCLSTMTLSYATGAKVVLMPPGRFDPDVAMELIEREHVTVDRRCAHGHVAHPRVAEPRQVRPLVGEARVATAARRPRPSSSSASRRCSRTCARRCRPRTGSPRPRRSRPRTAATTTSRIPVRSAAPRPPSSCASSTRTGTTRRPGERGEIWIKGPTVMNRGYWRRPDANAAAFTDGWFHTGDIGYLDADGFLYLVDRAKDMIIRAGENVYCVEIENVLFDHPDVIDAAVVGVPHKTLGEEVKAVVQLQARLDRDRRRHPRVLPRAPRRLQGAGVRRDPRRAAAAQPGGQGAEERAARRRLRVRDRRRPGALGRGADVARALRHPPRLGLRRDRRQLPRRCLHAGRVEVAALAQPLAVVADDHRRGDDDDPGVPRRAARERAGLQAAAVPHVLRLRRRSSRSGCSTRTGTCGSAKGWMELAYGLGGLFIMGLGIRAVLQVVADDGGRARRRVLLLFGGRSAEHDVSRVTAVAVARALDPEQVRGRAGRDHDRRPVAAGRRGGRAARGRARRVAGRVRGRGLAGGAAVGSGPRRARAVGRRARRSRVDVVFPLLHGPYGEDGTVQGLLELAGPAVRRRGRARLRGRHGQDHDEAGVRGGRACRTARYLDVARQRTTSARSRSGSRPSSASRAS